MVYGDGWRQVAATAFAVIMVTSVIVPVGGATTLTTSAGNNDATPGNGSKTPAGDDEKDTPGEWVLHSNQYRGMAIVGYWEIR